MSRPKAPEDPELGERIRAHLAGYPDARLSVYELSRVLGLPRPAGNGKDRVTRELRVLQDARVVSQVIEYANEHDSRPVSRWKITSGGQA